MVMRGVFRCTGAAQCRPSGLLQTPLFLICSYAAYVKFVGVSINTSGLSESDAMAYMDKVESEIGLPVVDPFRQGVARIVDNLLEL